MTLSKHYRIIGILLIVLSLIALAGSVMVGLLMGAFACDHPPGGDMTICFVFGGGTILFGFLMLALPPLLTAIGVFRRNPKMRRRVIICSIVFCLLFIPIGTIAGAYMLYVMLKLDPDGTYFLDKNE